MEKRCFRCGVTQLITNFYKHPQMGDGHLNKCKKCTISDSRKTELKLRSTEEGIMKDRKRGREKYYKLNYKDKYKPSPEIKKEIMERYKKRYPEKIEAHLYLRRHKLAPKENGNHLHHWSYNRPDWLDVIELPEKEHNKLHRYMTYDQERKMYRTLEGVLLDTRNSHIQYYLSIKNKP